MRKFILVAALALLPLLGGCAAIQRLETGLHAITSAQVSPEAVIIAANSFNALEASATNYLRLKRCTGTNGPVCRDPTVTKKLVPLVRSGRIARDGLIDFMKSHPGELGSQGLYDALKASIAGIQDIIAQYQGGAK